jgi:hypothetical protein
MNHVYTLILSAYGPRCRSYNPRCEACRAWAEYDAMKAITKDAA